MAVDTGLAATAGQSISGTVEAKDDPVENATVIATQFDNADYAAKESAAQEEIAEVQAELRNPEPDQWTTQVEDGFDIPEYNGSNEFKTDDGVLRAVGGDFVVVHTAEDWQEENILFPGGGGGSNPFRDPDLTQPKGFGVDNYLPADETLVLTPWNSEQFLGFAQNDIDEDLFGGAIPPDESPKIVVEELSPSGESVVSTTNYTVEKQFEAGFTAKSIGFVEWTPSRGFYHIYPQGAEVHGYIVSVGKPSRNIQPYIEQLRDDQDNLVDVAQHYRDRQGNGTVTQQSTTTDANGSFSISVGTRFDEVDLIAYKPATGLNTSVATRNDSREYYEEINVSDLEFEGQNASINASTDFDPSGMPGSVYLPGETENVAPPAGNVTVTMTEYAIPPRVRPSVRLNLTDRFRQWLRNRSYSELPPALQQRLNSSNVSTAELVETYRQLRDLVAQDDRMETTYCNFLAAKSEFGATCSDEFDAENASSERLIDRIGILQEVITSTRDEINQPEDGADNDDLPGNVSIGNKTVSVRFPFDQDLTPEAVLAKAIWANGTTDILNVSGPYLSIEDQLAGGDVVVISGYPLGDKDPAAVTFEVKVATEEGTGSVRRVVKNPTFNGSLPNLQSIDISSIRPGPNANVSFTLTPVDPATVDQITALEVYGPDDEQLNATITDDLSGAFDTDGAGRYHVRVTYNGSGDANFTETFRVLAGDRDHDLPPSIRVVESSISTFVLAGDGLSGGEIQFGDGGQSATIVATVPETSEDPAEVFFYASAADLAPDNDLTVRIAKGADQRSISGSSLVTVRMASVSDDALIWREGQALRQGEENHVGRISNNNSRTVIETFTEPDGSVTITTNSNPNILDRAQHFVNYQRNRFELPIIGSIGPVAPVGLVRDLAGWVV